jgi:tryptophan halogenase
MEKKLGVIGAGTAGILTLTHFCTWLDNTWKVVSIHDPKKKILGIGESTNGGFVTLLQLGTDFTLGLPSDMAILDATLKFGSLFHNWRKEDWINPLLDGSTAIHFNNFKFKEFAYGRLERLWPEKFRVMEGEVQGLQNHPDRVTATIDGVDHDFDYVVDCMGFPSDFTGYTMSDCTPVNRCLIHHQMPPYEYKPYTDHIAHKHGWMFGVPLQSRKTYGYLFNDTMISKEAALEDMRQELGVEKIVGGEYLFKCYYANSIIEGRICKNGNKALFFEPLVANSIFLYIFTARQFYDYITGAAGQPDSNAAFVKMVQQMEDLISYYYQGGSLYDTEFWRFASQKTRQRLSQRAPFHELLATYRDLRSRGLMQHGPPYALAAHNWRIIDQALGYNSF